MSQKVEKPVLQGQRIKTRKRDEKEKYDPGAFRDAVLAGLEEATDLEGVSKFLDAPDSKLDYRRYSDTLFDILFAGGILAPGGGLQEDAGSGERCRTWACVFMSEDDMEALKKQYEVFYKLIRRYKYLERGYDDELKKLLLFLKGFTALERQKLAHVMGISLASGLGNASCLTTLFEEHLIKEGLSMEFITNLFSAWLQIKDMAHISSALKKAGLDGKLLNLLPINKRTQENFENHFRSAGMAEVVEYQRGQAHSERKKKLQTNLGEMIEEEEPVKEMIVMMNEELKKGEIEPHQAVVMVWNSLMAAVEWNKKEDLVAEQALKHLKTYTPLLESLCQSARAQLALMQKVQAYCYDNTAFMKSFSKIIILFYKTDVLSEEIILKWNIDGHLPKGKSVFLLQMQKFVEWLKNAEEEDDSDEED